MIDPDYIPENEIIESNDAYPLYVIWVKDKPSNPINRRRVFDFIAERLESSISNYVNNDYDKLSLPELSTMKELYVSLGLDNIENDYAGNPQLQKHLINNVGEFLDTLLERLNQPSDRMGMLESLKFNKDEMLQYTNPEHFEPYSEVGETIIKEYGTLLMNFIAEPTEERFALASQRKLDIILGVQMVKRKDSGVLNVQAEGFNPADHIVHLYLG